MSAKAQAYSWRKGGRGRIWGLALLGNVSLEVQFLCILGQSDKKLSD